MVFEKPFKGVPDGEIYPVDYAPGDECPPELLEAAKACGVVAEDKPTEKKAAQK
ncbi:hypothetical protein [Duganella sp. Leaf126]|uniref:hypothetical protein n=1 Tax=Duganella sp. Leaf126 TaxID=1736266 RepID=UPI000AD90980|nr:hypothetical protein [Duganella sp. Leaf126]